MSLYENINKRKKAGTSRTKKKSTVTKDGKEWKGSMHKMPNGSLHTNKTHTPTSQKLVHYKDLSKKVKGKK